MHEVAVPDRLNKTDGVNMTTDAPAPQFAMALLFAGMVRSIKNGGDARPSFSQGFHTHSVIEAAHQSAVEHRWVRVRDLA